MIRLWIKSDTQEQALEFVYARGLPRQNQYVHPVPTPNVNNHLCFSGLEGEQVIEIDDCDAALGIYFPKILNWYAEVAKPAPLEELASGTLLYYSVLPE